MSNSKITLKDICGYKEEKREVENIITLLKNYKKYEDMGVTIPRGIIFQGPPGTGKTLFAKAIANECGYAFSSSYSDSLEENSLDTLKQAFVEAEKASKENNQPALVYIDELDKLVYTDSDGDLTDSDSREAVRFLLQKLDENSKENRVLIIASTNNYYRIPDALLRSGRFDKKFLIDLPDAESRKEILEYYINNHPLFREINTKSLALKTSGMSCADLKTLINNTLLHYIVDKDKIVLDDFLRIINEMNFETIGKKWSSKDTSIEVLSHEVGHAIIEFKLTGKWPNISALRYGDTAGHVETCDDFDEIEDEEDDLNALEEKGMKTYKDWLDDIVISLGGMAGEKVFLNQKSLGILSDISHVRHVLSRLYDNLIFGVNYSDIYFNDRAPEKHKMRVFNKSKRMVNNAIKKATKIIKQNKTLCIYLIDSIHNNNDVMSGREVTDVYNYYLEHKKEIDAKYKNLSVTDL